MSPAKATAAKAETTGKGPTLETHGLKLQLPPEMPFAAIEFMTDEPSPKELHGLLGVLLGDEQRKAVYGLGLGLAAGTELAGDIMRAMGTEPGESSASAES